MELWIGTTNKGKLSEMTLILQKEMPDLTVKSLVDMPHYSQPPENGKTFEENARIKAKSMKAMKPGAWVVTEDTGLVVEALGGLPGIHTARYAGPHARDSENVAKLLKMVQLKSTGDRSAKFVCVMIAYDPTGKEHVFNTELKGTIGRVPAGQMGFGYDPVFIPDGETKTLAEIGPAYKNKNSHRAIATRELVKVMQVLA
jgi:XTP/dITP diphosphohydrolase